MLLLGLGLGLLWLGVQLLLAGGSPYYLLAGLVLGAVAFLLWRQSAQALSVFGLFWLFTLAWAIWESGLAFWPLFGRLALLTFIGAWLLTPWVRRSLGAAPRTVLSLSLLSLFAAGLAGGIGWTFWNDRITGGTDLSMLGAGPANPRTGEWHHYGNSQAGTRHSPLDQITPANVGALDRVWTYSLGAEPSGMPAPFQATPLKIGDRLYLCAGYNDIIALDAETGEQVWRFAANADTTGIFGQTCRGVSSYNLPQGEAGAQCAQRIYTATIDARLIAVDARDGRLCEGFGAGGMVDLLVGMSEAPPGYYHVTSPPTVVSGKLVVGGWVTDGQMVGEPSGVIRAYDAVTGELAWAWDMGQPDRIGAPGLGETYTPGTPNSWSVMSADEELGLVYVPLGNATPDYTGTHRTPEMERYASSVVALDAETGRPRWHFQTTHHDVWDYDVPAQPVLLDLADGRPALLQPTKRGELFMLDRRTGEPIAEVTEREVAVSEIEGALSSPTQPFSTGLPSFAGPRPSEKRMWGFALLDQAWCRLKFRQARFEGTLTPLETERASIVWPGVLGGNNWGSIAVDPASGIAFVNSSHVLNYNRLIPRSEADASGLQPVAKPSFENVAGPVAQAGTPYAAAVAPFLSPLVAPCTEPPYGLVSAVDLNSGTLLWQKPFGTARDIGPLTMPIGLPIPMGVPNIGGAVVTGSGLAFIGATQEHMIRAYDIRTGRELWHGRLPAGGNATPMTYWSKKSGRQFVVIAAGGHGGILSGYSDTLVAYALPKAAAKPGSIPMSYVAMVTGATRGLGRGIARELGSKGARVAVTGRNKDDLAAVSREIEERGGTALPLACDHADDASVAAAFERVAGEFGGIDILVNNAAAVHAIDLIASGPFWEKPLKLVDMIDVGLRSNYVAAWHAAPLMAKAGKGLIASISFYGAVSYFHGAAYGAAKAGTDKMMADMAVDLAPFGVAAISYWPGFILTDAVRAMPEDMLPPDMRESLPNWETPEFTGRIIDALYADPRLMELTGRALIGAELGERYGIQDLDGKQPISYRKVMGAPHEPFTPAGGEQA